MKTGSIRVLVLAAAALALGGCARSPVIPYFGTGYNATTAPVDLQFKGTEIGTKEGRAHSGSVLGLFAWGDCSVDAAARNGGVARIDHIDCRLLNVVGVYQEYETIVSGAAE